MKSSPTTSLITRASLTATASHNAGWFARLVAGGVLSSAVSQAAVDNIWNGSVDSNWNTAGNWSLGHAPIKTGTEATNEHGVVSSTPANIATITADMTPIPTDIILRGPGRLDHRSGTAATGGGNWMYVGLNGGSNSIYNLADTTTPAGGISGYAQGSGTMNVSGRLYVGGAFGGGGTGVANINTSGTLAIGNDLTLGSGGGIGTMNVDSGTITTGGWNFIGKNQDGSGANGTLNMNGGTLTNTGRTYVGQNGCTGLLKLSGGDYLNVNNEQFIAGEDATSNGTITIDNAASELQIGGELWLGQNGGTGTMNLSAGTVSVNNWLAIARANNSTGVLNISGTGSFTKNSTNDFIVGSDGTGANGTINQSGGSLTVGNIALSLGRAGSSFGTYNLSAGTASLTGTLRVGEGGTGTLTMTGGSLSVGGNVNVATGGGSAGHINFDGGSLTTGRIIGGPGADTVDFNGTLINASASELSFISGLDTALLEAGGLNLNTGTSNITVPQILSGSGGITKTGTGTLTLSAFNTYSGTTTVNAGKLVTTTDSSGGGNLTVANGARAAVTAAVFDAQYNVANLSMGTGGTSNLDISYANIAGNPTLAPVNVTGTLNISGTAVLTLTNVLPEVGSFPLVKYTNATGGTFTLGPLPPGVAATLVHDVGAKLYRLNITSVAAPRWDGTFNNVWSTSTASGTQNWIDQVSGLPSFFVNGNPVLFNDSLSVPANSAIDLPGTVLPSEVNFDNTLATDYSISGTGKISGAAILTKLNTGNLTISTANDYTGVTTLKGGVTTVGTLTNGGVASPLGAASSAAGNLVLAGGTLAYTGAATTINRGYTVNADSNATVSTLSTVNNLGISGVVSAPVGGFTKAGAGTLTLSNPGANSLANGNFRINEGGLVLNGAGQTNTVTGAFTMQPGTQADLNSVTLSVGDVNIGETTGANATLNLNGSSTFTAANRVFLGNNTGANGTMVVSGTSTFNRLGGWLSIGGNGTGTLTVKDSGTVNNTPGDFNVSDVLGSNGTLNMQDSAVVNAGTTFVGKGPSTIGNFNISGGTFTGGALYIGQNGSSNGTITQTGGTITAGAGNEIRIGQDGVGTWNQSAGTVNISGWCVIARFATGTGSLNVSGGTFNQTQADRTLIVGEEGAGVLNITGTGLVNSMGTQVSIANNATTGNGIVNLDGGTLQAKRVTEGSGGVSAINFDGGTLKAGTGANANFMSGIDTATMEDGGLIVDSNGQTIAIAQSILDGGAGGGLTKVGTGTLYLNGGNTYLGLTTVSAGTLGGTGTIAGSISVATGATLTAGAPTGTLFADENVSFATGSNFGVTITGDVVGELAVADNLNITNANLVLTGTPTLQTYVLATYGTKTGTQFANHAAVSATLPAGYSIDYNYAGGTAIAIVRPVNAFEIWINTFFPGETDQNIVGTNADPDGDGNSNSLEFALGGAPNSATNNPKVYHFVADSSDAGTASELLMTIAVRNGTPVFAGSPSPSASQDGYTYTVQGSVNLAGFASAVSVVTPVTTDLPAAPTGYTYRTFSLDASNGFTSSRGFLRVNVTP